MDIEYQLPKREQPFFNFVKGVLRTFKKKVRYVVLGEPLDTNCLLLANHANKMGPMQYEIFLPVYKVTWGAHQMFGNYSSRRAYLKDVLYIQKNHAGKAKATFKSWYEAMFSQYFYKGMKMVPTYPDARLLGTVKKSVDALNDDTAVMVFPENSNAGYTDRIKSFFPGFVLVMEKYFKVNGKDVPARPVYYHVKKRIMVVGEKYYLQDLKEKGMDKRGVAEFFKDKVNELYDRIESGEFDKE